MPTKFYLPSSGTAPATPAQDSDWENFTISTRLPCYTTKQSTTMTTVSLTGDTNKLDQDILFRMYVSPQLSAQSIGTQTVQFVARCSETDTENNLYLTINIRSWNGSTFQDIVSMYRGSTEATTTLTNRLCSTTTSNVTVAAGDRLVIEIGMGGDPAASGADGHNSSIRIGDAASSDCVANETGTDDYNPWISFSSGISFQTTLTVNDAYSTTQTDSFKVTKGTSITGLADANCTSQVDGVVLTGVSTSLVVNDAFSTTQTDHVSTTKETALGGITDAYCTTQADNVSTTKETSLGGITDAYCTTQTDSVITTLIHNLTGISDAYCETQADAVVITGPSGIDLTVADAYCLTQADTISYLPQILFPESTIHYGNWTNESGVGDTNLYQSVDEANYSDADYAQSEWNPASSPVVFKLQNGSDPTSASGHILRYRIEKYPDDSETQAVTVQLRQDYIEEGSQGTLIAEWVDSDLSETIAIVERILTADEANSITDYTSLFVRIMAS